MLMYLCSTPIISLKVASLELSGCVLSRYVILSY
jgi:hypothetical protein